ncbi:unnamed protein product [Closterium sp. NIES-54]
MTHGRQPHGCLLPALLTTRSARGGHFGQGGAEARGRHFSRGGVRCGMVWCGMRRRTLRATSRHGGKEAALQQRCSAVWNGMVRYEEEADTSGNEPARRQGGGTSAEV